MTSSLSSAVAPRIEHDAAASDDEAADDEAADDEAGSAHDEAGSAHDEAGRTRAGWPPYAAWTLSLTP